MLKSSTGLASILPAALALAAFSFGCSGGSDPSADGGSGGTQEACAAGFLPLKVGIKWTYTVTDLTGGGTETKEQAVEALEAVPEKTSLMAYRLRTRKGTGFDDETVSWQQISGTQVVRYREQSYRPGVGGAAPTPRLLETWEPYKLRLDQTPDKLEQGKRWDVAYKETASNQGVVATRDRNERWEVVGVNQSVTVPAGTYPKALVLRRVGTDQSATSDKRYWFVCGLGKVKEAGDQTEELTKVEGL